MDLTGLSNVYPGYLQGRQQGAIADLDEAKASDAMTQVAGRAAFGRALQSMFGQQMPPPPMPGQPSMAQAPGGVPQQPGMPPQAPQPLQGGMPPGMMPAQMPGRPPMMPPRPPGGPGLTGMPTAMPQPPGAGMGGGAPQGGPPPGPGGTPPPGMNGPGVGGPQGGQLDWRMVIQRVTQANPGAPPQVIAAAVDQFVPMMNMESRLQWQEMRAALQVQLAEMKGRQAEALERSRSDDRRYGADTRRDIATQHEEGVESRFETAEGRRAASADLKERQFAEKLRKNAADESYRKDRDTANRDLRQWSTLNSAKYKATVAEIQANRDVTNPAERKRLIDQAQKDYIETEEEITRLRRNIEGRTNDEVPSDPDTPQPTPQPGKPRPSASGGAYPPAAAIAQLKEGVQTPFENGQVWTLKNGKPTRVK